MEKMRRVVSSCGNESWLSLGHTNWTEKELITIPHYLRGFVVNYKTENNKEVKSTTMNSYLLSLQRGFESEWGYKLKLLEGNNFLTSLIKN